MTIYTDRNEPEEFDYLLTRMGIEVKRDSFNKTSETGAIFADFTIITESGTTSVNRKQAVEAMADLDKVEAQLMSELAACPKLVFCYEGTLTWTEDGTYAGDAESVRVVHHSGRRDNEYDVLTSRGRTIHQPHARWTAFVYKLQDLGIPVIPTGNIQGTASFLHYLHSNHSNNLFRRLLATRQQVAEIDPEKRQLALTLMGIQGARWGEEMAMAVADYLAKEEMPVTLKSVMTIAEWGIPLQSIPLRSGKRRVGDAAAQRLFAALGY